MSGDDFRVETADSVTGADAGELRQAWLWRYDSLLAPSGSPQVLPVGVGSSVRWIVLSVPPEQSFGIVLISRAERAGSSVTAQAPGTVPAWYWADSNWIPMEPGGPRYVPNAISIIFKSTASLAERQAAIDLVGGDVIGGMQAPGGAEGSYIVTLPSVSTNEQLLSVRATRHALPQVSHAWLQVEATPSRAPQRASSVPATPPDLQTKPERQSRKPVGMQPPDSIPKWVYASTNILSNAPGIPGTVIKNVVVVQFASRASQTERQAAVDLVEGDVVGGNSDGYYWIKIPTDNTGRTLLAAIAKLRALPYVLEAVPDRLLSLQRQPNDDRDRRP